MHERGGDWLSDLVKPARNKENMWPVGNSNKRMSIGNRLSTPSFQMSNVFGPTREEDIDFCLGEGGRITWLRRRHRNTAALNRTRVAGWKTFAF